MSVGQQLLEDEWNKLRNQYIGEYGIGKSNKSKGSDYFTEWELNTFKKIYGWTPPYGVTKSQVRQYMADNPNATPQELEQGLINFLGRNSGKINNIKSDDIINYIINNLNKEQMNILKRKADEAGISSIWHSTKTDILNYLNSMKDLINEAINNGYSQEQIVNFLLK